MGWMSKKQKKQTPPRKECVNGGRQLLAERWGELFLTKKKKNGDGEVSEGEGRGLQLLCESFAI